MTFSILLHILLLSCLLWLCLAFDMEPSIANKSFIFISGYPQSGTSIVLKMFEVLRVASTMLTGCPRATKQPLLCYKRNGEGRSSRLSRNHL